MAEVNPDPELGARRRWMAVLARATAGEIAARLDHAPALPPHVRLRGPEVGLVMARGRQGGDGAPFNLGEITVTRCTVRLAATPAEPGLAGPELLGHAHVAGRDLPRAELAATLDAALQDPTRQPALLAAVIEPLAAAQAARVARDGRKAAATRVEFFTMATMR